MSSILTLMLCVVVLCVYLVRDNSFSVGLVIADAIADATRADAIGPPPLVFVLTIQTKRGVKRLQSTG